MFHKIIGYNNKSNNIGENNEAKFQTVLELCASKKFTFCEKNRLCEKNIEGDFSKKATRYTFAGPRFPVRKSLTFKKFSDEIMSK